MADSQPTPAALRRRNRDHERLYRPGVLSVWFLFFSVLLVVAVGAMIWKDYQRPWKAYQKAYFEKEMAIARDEARAARARVFTLEQDLKSARSAVERTRAELAAVRVPATYDELIAERHRLKRLLDAADAEVKNVKGLLAPARYVFETKRAAFERAERLREAQRGGVADAARYDPVEDGDVVRAREAMEAARTDVLRHGQALYEAEDRYLTAAANWQDASRRIAALEKPWRDAQRTLDDLLASKAQAENKLAGLEGLYAGNGWRNAPFIDFITPSIKVRQTVLANIHDDWNFATNPRVDRCITCHVGVASPTMGAPETIETYDLKNWMRAHPGLDLIAGPTSPHPVEAIGCTVCHHGVGWATDFSRAAHIPGDDVTKARWEDEHHWHEPHYIEYPMLPTEYAEGQCWKCHKEGIAWPVHYEERLDHGFVAGTDPVSGAELGQRRFPDGDPRAALAAGNRMLGPWEVYGGYALTGAPKPRSPRKFPEPGAPAAPATMNDVIAHQWETTAGYGADEGRLGQAGGLLDRYEDEELVDRWVDTVVHGYGWTAERYDRGYDTIVQYRCQGCHKIESFGQQVGYGDPPRVAPALGTLPDKVVDIQWVYKWIKHPELFRPTTKMPSFFWFVDKDWQWNVARNEDGTPRILPVADAHMLDPTFALELGSQVTTDDEDMWNLQVLAMATYLMNQPRFAPDGAPRITTRRDPAQPEFYNPDYDEVLPAGDIERGRALVDEKGCTACHIVPEVRGVAGWQEDSPERFSYDPLRMLGPSLQGLGSKFKDGAWLNAWLKNPRHYTPTTTMGDMRLEDKFDAQGVKVADGAQMRADIIAYLLSTRAVDFDAAPELGWNDRYEPILREMVESFFGKDATTGEWIRRDVIKGETGSLSGSNLATQLARVGEKLMSRNGCFGCHETPGFENDNPVGVDLSKHGSKDLHQLDFGVVSKALIPHTRWDFFEHKVRTPRIYDTGKLKPWADKLRMPRFNLWSPPQEPEVHEDVEYRWPFDSRRAVAAMIAGFTSDKIRPEARANPDAGERELIEGRAVVKRYGCNQCHTIEGLAGLYWRQKAEAGVDPATLPPNLFGQGYRTQTEWLVKFVQEPFWLRPIVNVHMPRFGLSDAEAQAVARYFVRLAGPDVSTIQPQADSLLKGHRFKDPLTLPARGDRPASGPLTGWVDEARALFDTAQCNKCHLPKGAPGADPQDGGVAPTFEISGERLRSSWVEALLYNPGHLIDGTKMTQFWTLRSDGYGRNVSEAWRDFQFWLRDDEAWRADYTSGDPEREREALKRLAEVQIRALTDYVLHHYQPPAPAAEPAPGR